MPFYKVWGSAPMVRTIEADSPEEAKRAALANGGFTLCNEDNPDQPDEIHDVAEISESEFTDSYV